MNKAHGAPTSAAPGVMIGGIIVAVVAWKGATQLADGAAAVGLFGLFAVLGLALVVAVATLFVRVQSSFMGGAGSADGMATKASVQTILGESPLRASASQTRPTLPSAIVKAIDPNEIGLSLGKDVNTKVNMWLSFEDHLAVTAPTGSGKSVRIMAPAALAAPGALIVTTNEVSILDLIATARARKGKVWVFDPLDRAYWPEQMVWNPVRGAQDGKVALSRANAFVTGMKSGSDSTNGGFFKTNAQIALSRMLHAAALTGADMGDVLSWAQRLDTKGEAVAGMIRDSTDPRVEKSWAESMESVSTGADDTVASSRQTLAQAVEPLALQQVLKWVTNTAGGVEFDPRSFVLSTDTLVLISDDTSPTNVGPLCTMLFQEIMDVIKELVPTLEHRRLDPPMRVVGDEFANIAPVEKAPELSSEVRKLGVQLILAFQDEQQLKSRWGDRGKTLLGSMSAEIVLPGLKATESLKRYSDLAGRVWVQQHSTSYNDGRSQGGTTSMHQRDVIEMSQVRTLANGTGFLLYRNLEPVITRLTPWYETPEASQLTAEAEEVKTRRLAHARRQGVELPDATPAGAFR